MKSLDKKKKSIILSQSFHFTLLAKGHVLDFIDFVSFIKKKKKEDVISKDKKKTENNYIYSQVSENSKKKRKGK